MYGYIYKTTNIVNGKIYVGQKKSKEFLGQRYLGSGKYLKCAIQHYGEDKFVVSLIKTANSKEELNDLEKFYIKKFNATDYDIGYNIANGAVGGDTYTHLSDKDKRERIRKHADTKKRNNKKLVCIHMGDVDKRVEQSLLEDYLSRGWVRGRSEQFQKKLDDGRKGIKQSEEWIRKRVESGWLNKSSEEYELMRKKHSVATKRQMANTPKEERIERARNANKFRGHKCCFVHKGEEIHFIYKDDLQKYLDMGFSTGMYKD